MSNPLLSPFNTPYEMPPFAEIKEEHYTDAIEKALDEARHEMDVIISNEEEPSFSNVIEAMEMAGERLQRNTTILFNLNSAETNDEIQKITQELSPKLSSFSSEVKQNPDLFAKVKAVYNHREKLDLTVEQQKLLRNTYLDFVRRGVELEGSKKDRFREISIELSQLSLKYGENVLAETNAYELVIEDESDLEGLPSDVKNRAELAAAQKGMVKKWIFTLQAPATFHLWSMLIIELYVSRCIMPL